MRRERETRGKSERWVKPARTRLLLGMALALMITAVLVMSVEPGGEGSRAGTLSQSLLSGKSGLSLDTQALASRMVEQKFQIHMEELEQQPGEIPYVEVWVLNDPFYPLMGEVGNLRQNSGDLASKEWQMLGFPNYQAGTTTGTATGAPVTSAPSATPVTTDVSQRVVMVTSIYEIRGIRYADIKVNDTRYEKLKAGSTFAEVFKVQEIRDEQTVILTCGDETYELKVNQLRKL